MNLEKFLFLISTRTLFFSPPTSFSDPYEGHLPKKYIEVLSKNAQNFFKKNLDSALITERNPEYIVGINNSAKTYNEEMASAFKNINSSFGVNCWHENEYESEAMWKLYAHDSIAIESTTAKLKESFQGNKTLIVDNVRYYDFENDEIEKGHANYVLFLKRLAFSHEQEVRAIIKLDNQDTGEAVPYDLDGLISRIYISPYAVPYLKDVIADLCSTTKYNLNKDIVASDLALSPSYKIEIKTI